MAETRTSSRFMNLTRIGLAAASPNNTFQPTSTPQGGRPTGWAGVGVAAAVRERWARKKQCP